MIIHYLIFSFLGTQQEQPHANSKQEEDILTHFSVHVAVDFLATLEFKSSVIWYQLGTKIIFC